MLGESIYYERRDGIERPSVSSSRVQDSVPSTRGDNPTASSVDMYTDDRESETRRQTKRLQESHSLGAPTVIPSPSTVPRSSKKSSRSSKVEPPQPTFTFTPATDDLLTGRPAESTQTRGSSKHSRSRTNAQVGPNFVVEPQRTVSSHDIRTTSKSKQASRPPIALDTPSSNFHSHSRTVSGLIPTLEGLGVRDRSELPQSESRSHHSTRKPISTAPEIVQFSSPIDISRITIQKNRELKPHEVIFNTTSKLLEHGSDVKVRTLTGPGRFSAPNKYEFLIHNNYCQAGSKLHLTVAIPQS